MKASQRTGSENGDRKEEDGQGNARHASLVIDQLVGKERQAALGEIAARSEKR